MAIDKPAFAECKGCGHVLKWNGFRKGYLHYDNIHGHEILTKGCLFPYFVPHSAAMCFCRDPVPKPTKRAVCYLCGTAYETVTKDIPKRWKCHACGETMVISTSGKFVGGVKL